MRQRCPIHRRRTYLAKVPTQQQQRRDPYRAIVDTDDLIAADLTPGGAFVGAVQRRIDAVAAQYRRAFPSAIVCPLSDREQLTSCPRFPVEHHRRIRHSNFIERTFGETRRQVTVIGRLPGEASRLNPVWPSPNFPPRNRSRNPIHDVTPGISSIRNARDGRWISGSR
jgi:putative transposase